MAKAKELKVETKDSEKASRNALKRIRENTKYGESRPVKEIVVKVPSKEVEIIPLGDVHIGDKQLDFKLLKSMVDYIKDTPDAYTILNGDILDMALKLSKSDVYSQTGSPTEQILAAWELLEPIKNKILLVVRGNHEYRGDKDSGMNPLLALCAKLETLDRYAGDTYNLVVKNSKNQALSILGSHGSGIKGNDAPSIMSSIKRYITKTYRGFHWYLFSHKHIPGHFEEEIVPDNVSEDKRLTKIVIDMLPAMLKSGAGYGSFYNFALTSTLHKTYTWRWVNGEPTLEMKDFLPKLVDKAKKRRTPDEVFLEKLKDDSDKAMKTLIEEYGGIDNFIKAAKKLDSKKETSKEKNNEIGGRK